MKKITLSIPKPCNENWNAMAPNREGKFCNACKTTVIDFTEMSPIEIKAYLLKNKHKRVCGKFKAKTLDAINIYIPQSTLRPTYNFRNTFLLALLITMGTSLMNCTNEEGKTQKIQSVNLVKPNTSLVSPTKELEDSLKLKHPEPQKKSHNTYFIGMPIKPSENKE